MKDRQRIKREVDQAVSNFEYIVNLPEEKVEYEEPEEVSELGTIAEAFGGLPEGRIFEPKVDKDEADYLWSRDFDKYYSTLR